MVNAMLWVLRTGSPWRDLPSHYGSWKSCYTRFRRWAQRGHWSAIVSILAQAHDHEGYLIDATVVRAHQHAAGAKGGRKDKRWGDLAAV